MEQENVIVRCAGCGTKNRIPKSRTKDHPACGKCHKPLSLITSCDRPVNVLDQNFDTEVIHYPGAVLVDCWAQWCGPCRTVAPVLDQIAKEYSGRVKVAKLNVDENPLTASKYSVKSIPTLLLFKNGQLVNTRVGALPKSAVEQELHAIL